METRTADNRYARLWALLFIVGAATVANLNVLGAGFVWDDRTLIANNAFIRHWHTLPSLFTHTFLATYYRPVVILSFALEYALWGLNPLGFHLTNLMLHVVNSVLAFVVFRYATRDTNTAFFGALLFAVHPAHKGVVYIADRTGMLSTVFFLAAFILYVGRRGVKSRAPATIRYVGSLASFVLALFSKEEALMLPVVLLVDTFMASEGTRRGRLVEAVCSAPFFAMAVLFVFIRGTVIRSVPGILQAFGIEPVRRLLTVPWLLVHYLFLLVFPFNLNFNARMPLASSLSDIRIWTGGCAIILLVGLIPWLLKRFKPVAFGVLWFLIVFVPMSNIIPIFPDIADHALFTPVHFLYLPSIGVFLCAGYAFNGLIQFLQKPTPSRFLSMRAALLCFACIIFAFSLLSLKRNTVWKNDIRLFRNMILVNPADSMAHGNLGGAYLSAGRLEEAFKELSLAVKLDSQNPINYKNLGVVLLEMGSPDSAIGAFRQCILLKPDDATAYSNLAIAYVQKGMLREAIAAGEKAIAIDPSSSQARTNVGLIYMRAGMLEAAEKQFLEALKNDPDDADAQNALGALYFRRGEYARARMHWEKALRIRPTFEEARKNLNGLDGRMP